MGELVPMKEVRRLVFCTGQIYYDLLEKRRATKTKDVAIIRLEQVGPFPYEEVETLLKEYPGAKEFVWAQEEPLNFGAWNFVSPRIQVLMDNQKIKKELIFQGRPPSGSPATGFSKLHAREQETIVTQAIC
eukprot:TRINITY_DN946_c0_g2_i2.p1 TRINITY_DN946_c0_g2~~TRINITY_DN946_c0_g2_i2.p1  ORF type:complete len:131 (+),score=52.26 TRINITY_DN946_c0_g2_i2:98-490(+)